MDNLQKIYHAILSLSDEQSGLKSSPCPDPETLLNLSENTDSETVTHIAFCPDCQGRLQIIHTGKRYQGSDPNPNWDKLLSNLIRRVRWEILKQKIAGAITTPIQLCPDLLSAPVRLAGTSPPSLSLTIFEINLSTEPELSSHGLTVSTAVNDDHSGQYTFLISGFLPGLQGAEVRLGFARKQSFLRACNDRTAAHDPDLTQIEKKLQHGFSRQKGPSQRLGRLINESIWISGFIRSDLPNPGDTSLLLHPTDDQMALFSRRDVWMMILVGDHAGQIP